MKTIAESDLIDNNDISDFNIDLVYTAEFKNLLHDINSIILPKFSVWDNKSLTYQRYRQNIMLLMIFTGIIIIVVMIPDINKILPEKWGGIIQNAIAFLVFVLLLIGIKYNFQKKWLLYRHKSELLRLLKFHTLLDPMTLSLHNEIPLKKLQQSIDEIDQIDQNTIDKFVKDEFDFWKYDRIILNPSERKNFLDLIKYYQNKRIKSQIDYFAIRAKSRENIDRYTKYLPKITNFSGVFLLSLYFILGIFSYTDISKKLSFLVVIAAILPVVGSSVKSYRTTNEISRIASIYRTRQNKLSHIYNNLLYGLKQENIDINKEFELMYECERILKEEHQEWLRLMIQSEWIT